MSSLTEEQRRRIEENRRKALEKRAAASKPAVSSSTLTNKNTNNSGTTQFSNPAPVKTFQAAKVTASNSNTNSSFKQSSSLNANQFPKAPENRAVPVNSQIANAFYGPTKTFPSKTVSSVGTGNYLQNGKSNSSNDIIKGTCVLISRQRFTVDVKFHKELIEVFKSIPNRLYDMQTKKWNFPVKDHDKLISLVKPLHSEVILAPLPKVILNVFKSAPATRTIEDVDLSRLDPFMLKTLLPFQKEGVQFAVKHNGRVLIADDMGLGKTIQAIAVANYYSNDWPLLVVTPSSVRYSWEESFHNWLPSLDRQEVSVINSGKDHIPNNKVVLMSYDLLTKMKDSILKRKFKMIIFDESHFLKNPKSARTKAAQDIMKQMNRIVMLTGTPALSRPIELFTQISALGYRGFLSYVEYGVRYCNGKQNTWGWDFSGSSNMEELQILLEEILMIRRLKSDVIKQLPDKFRQMVVLDPSLVSTKSKVLKAMYNKMQAEDLKGMERRGALLEYFHETGEVKLKAVCQYVVDLLEGEKKFVCFAHHQNVLNGICRAIEEKKVDHIRIDGSVSSEQRKKLCDKFQLNDKCQVAVLSITSANCGITLTAASLVVFAELFWNPGILTQAEDRTHRIGQENSVVVQYLVAKGTADDEIWPLVQRKLDILNKAGLSKDNFKSADTIVQEDSAQLHLEDFWGNINESLKDENDESFECEVPEKRAKIEL
ncbi:hypothetical protein JTE90_023489 [Oedothorax gibbosus]|uniref:SWI/SNF-related matrix-associated actin-dependent regulator of chromatin subfamily A-like protein 1 n=1 Tax=Oedothorax gibbosus TaxID=931172 RepID=A0AAV6VSJ7_9ARAC|nr:hypothetical protein JTE90_023489 [Oedothorax gibbosus]